LRVATQGSYSTFSINPATTKASISSGCKSNLSSLGPRSLADCRSARCLCHSANSLTPPQVQVGVLNLIATMGLSGSSQVHDRNVRPFSLVHGPSCSFLTEKSLKLGAWRVFEAFPPVSKKLSSPMTYRAWWS
jgi:hypothetical protein